MMFLNSLIENPISFLTTVLAIVVVFGTVIFVHEFGHFIVAKKSGVKVDEFAFGFGPKMFSFQFGETLYSVNWIPLGGYNKFQGEVTENYSGPVLEGEGSQQSSSRDQSRDFMAQPWTQRILIALAGPFMNYVMAFMLFVGMLVIWGEPFQTNKTEVGEVMAGMPAEAAGLKPGDHVLSVEGETTEDFISVATRISRRPGLSTTLAVSRDGQQRYVTVVPIDDNGRGMIGIRPADPKTDHRPINFSSALKKGAWQCWNISAGTIYYLYLSVTERRKPDLAGPIGITREIARSAQRGMEDLIYLVAMISVAIGLFNLFPIPLLDGGHVVYYLVEGIQRRPVSEKFMSKFNMVGLALLLSLLVFATFSDIQRLFK